MPVPSLIDWPIPKSPLLSDIVRSIRARSKAFKNKVREFDIGLTTDTEMDSVHERLNLDIRDWSANPQRLSFAFWDDGTLRLDARQPSKSGWQYEITIYAQFKNVDPDEVRDMIERSMWLNDPKHMETVWMQCKPYN